MGEGQGCGMPGVNRRILSKVNTACDGQRGWKWTRMPCNRWERISGTRVDIRREMRARKVSIGGVQR